MAANPIFTAQTTNRNSAAMPSTGCLVTILVKGTFDGASVYVQFSPDDGTSWFTPTDLVFTAEGLKDFQVGKGLSFRVVQVSSGASTSLTTWIAYAQ